MMKLGLICLFLLFLAPERALALQVHPPPEGLIAHQLAHLFFAFAMALFAYRIKRMNLLARPHWNHLFVAAILLILWNLWAFCGHLVALKISDEVILPQGGDYHFCQKSLLVKGPWELLFYLFKFDNLFTLPAFYLIYRGLSRIEAILRGET